MALSRCLYHYLEARRRIDFHERHSGVRLRHAGTKSAAPPTFSSRYNNTLTWERDQDAAFGEIAREIRSRHPLRTYLKIPFLRAITIWFQPRVELLPYSGNLFPVRLEWREDRRDFRATLTLVSANLIYIALASGGPMDRAPKPRRSDLW